MWLTGCQRKKHGRVCIGLIGSSLYEYGKHRMSTLPWRETLQQVQRFSQTRRNTFCPVRRTPSVSIVVQQIPKHIVFSFALFMNIAGMLCQWMFFESCRICKFKGAFSKSLMQFRYGRTCWTTFPLLTSTRNLMNMCTFSPMGPP